MNRRRKPLTLLIIGLVLILVGTGAVSLLFRDRSPGPKPPAANGTPTATWVATMIAPMGMFIAIIALSQSESWPVTQAFAALRLNRPERREQQLLQYTSRRFSSSGKFAKLAQWTVPKGEKTKVVKEGDLRQVVANFADGGEYTFVVVKRAKDDPKGSSGYVIDDVSGGEFDADC